MLNERLFLASRDNQFSFKIREPSVELSSFLVLLSIGSFSFGMLVIDDLILPIRIPLYIIEPIQLECITNDFLVV